MFSSENVLPEASFLVSTPLFAFFYFNLRQNNMYSLITDHPHSILTSYTHLSKRLGFQIKLLSSNTSVFRVIVSFFQTVKKFVMWRYDLPFRKFDNLTRHFIFPSLVDSLILNSFCSAIMYSHRIVVFSFSISANCFNILLMNGFWYKVILEIIASSSPLVRWI